MERIEMSTSYVYSFLMVDATDDEAPEPGLTPVPVVKISKNGGSFATTTNAATEISDGWYKVTLTTTETNTNGSIAIFATATGCDRWNDKVYVATTPATVTIGDLSTAICNKIADHALRRTAANIEASATGADTLDLQSLYGMVAMAVNKTAATASDTVTVYKANNTTALGTFTVATTTDNVRITSIASN